MLSLTYLVQMLKLTRPSSVLDDLGPIDPESEAIRWMLECILGTAPRLSFGVCNHRQHSCLLLFFFMFFFWILGISRYTVNRKIWLHCKQKQLLYGLIVGPFSCVLTVLSCRFVISHIGLVLYLSNYSRGIRYRTNAFCCLFMGKITHS